MERNKKSLHNVVLKTLEEAKAQTEVQIVG
jgi:hypothetical protein